MAKFICLANQDVHIMNDRAHKFKSALTHERCAKCGKMASDIAKYISKNVPEARYQPITLENLSKYYPCITDQEALIKNIIQ